jgi:hypothetical protein
MPQKKEKKAIPYVSYGLGLNLDCSVLKQPGMLTDHYYRRISGVMLGEGANADLKAMGWRGTMDADVLEFKKNFYLG